MAQYVRFARKDGSTGAGVIEKDTIRVIEEPFWETTRTTGERISMGSIRLLPPCQPRSIVCVGLNYASHLGGRPVPDPPTLFLKPLSSIAGHQDEIVLPRDAGRVDPEGEIVVVIGRETRHANRDEAIASIFGYTSGNDVSARVWQRGDGQWWRAKGADTFGIFGPDIVTGLEHDAIEIVARVNGTEVQRGRSDELILDIPDIVSYVSAVMTLVPGDVIFTGTPGSPPELQPGDVVEVEISGGAAPLKNPVVSEQ